MRAGRPIDVCGFTQLLVPAFVVAFAVSTLTASDALGWASAAVTALALAIARKVRGTTSACALPAAPREAATSAAPAIDRTALDLADIDVHVDPVDAPTPR
jgi:hypothetical protein